MPHNTIKYSLATTVCPLQGDSYILIKKLRPQCGQRVRRSSINHCVIVSVFHIRVVEILVIEVCNDTPRIIVMCIYQSDTYITYD